MPKPPVPPLSHRGEQGCNRAHQPPCQHAPPQLPPPFHPGVGLFAQGRGDKWGQGGRKGCGHKRGHCASGEGAEKPGGWGTGWRGHFDAAWMKRRVGGGEEQTGGGDDAKTRKATKPLPAGTQVRTVPLWRWIEPGTMQGGRGLACPWPPPALSNPLPPQHFTFFPFFHFLSFLHSPTPAFSPLRKHRERKRGAT